VVTSGTAARPLPPAFPATVIGHKPYWDGGLFDNTPLGAVIERLDSAAGVNRTIYVVNLFPNKAPILQNLLEIEQRLFLRSPATTWTERSH
jgi:NTE family protein